MAWLTRYSVFTRRRTSTPLRSGHLVKPAEVGSMAKHARCAGRTDRAADFQSQHIGMRCCHDAN